MSGRRGPKGQGNVFYSVLAGALISAVALLALLAVAAIIVNMTGDPLSAIPTAALSATLCAAAVSGYTISKRTKEGKMLTVTLSSLLFCLVLLIIGLAVSGGALSGSVFLNYICYMGISLISARLGAKEKRRKR